METHISQKPPLPTTSSVSASTSSSSSPSTSSIKIERVLNSASIETFLQSSTTAARRLSLPPTPPPAHLSSLPLTTLLVVESPREPSARVQYRQPQPPPLPPPLSSTPSEHSMATTAVATPPSHVMQPFTRPIRFVANDGQPHAKRRRITAAYVTFCIPPLKPRVNQREKKESLLFFFYVCSVFQPTLPPHINPRPCVLRGSEIYIHVHTACLFFRSKFVHTCAFLYHQEHVLSFPNWSFVSVLVRLHILMLTCLSHLTGL